MAPIIISDRRSNFHTQKEDPMDADQLKCKWVQFKRALKTRLGRFRDDHLVQSEGSYDKVVDKAHEPFGDKKDEFMHKEDRPAA